jgi:L-threonylcarbamoyladenylate synthase
MQHQKPSKDSSVWRIAPQLPIVEEIRPAALCVKGGGVIIYPTETFYGLGAHPFVNEAIERVYLIKGRDFDKPLPLIASDVDAVRHIVSHWPATAERLARAFWPGPLSLILPSSPLLPPLIHARTGKIAIRVTSHPIAQALAAAVGGVIISTSANEAGLPAHADPQGIPPALLSRVDGIIDGGLLPGQLPSTIVDLSSPTPQLVRAGCLSWETIKTALGLDI